MREPTSHEQTFRGPGISFRHPEDWELTEEPRNDELSINLQSGGTSFCSITLLYGRPAPERVLDAAVHAYRDEYDDVDVYPVETRVARHSAIGRDVEFFCLELCNTAFLRAFRTGRFTLLLLFQASDDELQATRTVFDRISGTLDCDTDMITE